MARHIPIAPIYASEDLARMLEAEETQLEETISEMTDDQLSWRPLPQAKNALEIIGHITYFKVRIKRPPKDRKEALARLRRAHGILRQEIKTPGRLEEPYPWHTGDSIPYRGVISSEIRHRCYHLGELVYLRQAQGLDRPHYYHDK